MSYVIGVSTRNTSIVPVTDLKVGDWIRAPQGKYRQVRGVNKFGDATSVHLAVPNSAWGYTMLLPNQSSVRVNRSLSAEPCAGTNWQINEESVVRILNKR